MNTHPKSLSEQAHEHEQQQHARALAAFHDCAQQNDAEREHEQDEPAEDATPPQIDPNQRARELRAMLEHDTDPEYAATLLLAEGPVFAIRAALALATLGVDPQRLAPLRIELDMRAEDLESRFIAADECARICAALADAMAADADPLEMLEQAANQLAEIGYTVNFIDDEPAP